MMTPDERRAVYIAAMKFGFEEFAKLIKVDPNDLRKTLKGGLNLSVERAIRRNWGLVKELLHGYRRPTEVRRK